MTAHERLTFMRDVVIAKMQLHPNDKTFVRFNTTQLMALIDVGMAADSIPKHRCSCLDKTCPVCKTKLALKRLADT